MAANQRQSAGNATARVLNCIPSKNRELDWGFTNALQAGISTSTRIPPALDLRTRWWTVGDQGSTGSCVGWATADAVLRWHLVKARKLSTKQHLSVRFLWMSSKELDEFSSYPSSFIDGEGTSLKAALDVARKYGVVPEEILPFNSATMYNGETRTLFATASKYKINSYFSLGNRVADWRRWIATNGPILTRLDVDHAFRQAHEGAAKLDVYDPASAEGGHAVALVGYTLKHFIVRNSWGTSWGDGGFAYATNDYATAAFTELYGVSL